MLKFLLSKFKEVPGPLKQTRLVVGDLAEEVLDLVEHYLKHGSDGRGASPQWNAEDPSMAKPPAASQSASESSAKAQAASSKTEAKTAPKPAPVRTLEVSERLGTALDNKKNQKKQEFKILAILWDANDRNLGTLSAKGVSDRGVLLGLAIRHENVRKVIRMRLGQYVETLTEQIGNNRIYRYKISESGSSYFESKYLADNDE